MQVSVENIGSLERKVHVEVPESRVTSEISERLQNMTKTTKVEGFRPGKVPLKVINGRYGEQVRKEVVGELESLISKTKLFNEKSYLKSLKIVKSITGKEAFVLWDTFGFPVEEIDSIAQENSLKVNLEEFNNEMESQRNRARETAKFGGDRAKIRVYESLGVGATGFMGYDHLSVSSVVVGLIVQDQIVDEVKKGQEVEIALLQTPFYPEGGGQVGDSGRIVNDNTTIDNKNQDYLKIASFHFVNF